MPAHSTCEDALASVAAFAAADVERQRKEARHKTKKSKHKRKEKDKTREKQRHKDGKNGKRMHKETSDSDSDASPLSANDNLEDQLLRGRNAARATRELLARYPEVRRDLREVGVRL